MEAAAREGRMRKERESILLILGKTFVLTSCRLSGGCFFDWGPEQSQPLISRLTRQSFQSFLCYQNAGADYQQRETHVRCTGHQKFIDF